MVKSPYIIEKSMDTRYIRRIIIMLSINVLDFVKNAAF